MITTTSKPVYCPMMSTVYYPEPERKKVLVTGACGLIGSAISIHLTKQGYAVVNYDPPKGIRGNLDQPYYALVDCARYECTVDQRNVWQRVKAERLILFSSIYGHTAPDFSIYEGTEVPETPLEYAMWKGGVEQATRYLAEKLKPDNVQVNCIAPGGVYDDHSALFQSAYLGSGGVPMIWTRNILPVIDMLLNPDNAVNGQVITVDGGWSL